MDSGRLTLTDKPPFFVYPEEFVSYLKETLIPDLRASGRDATADDFQEAIYWIQKLR